MHRRLVAAASGDRGVQVGAAAAEQGGQERLRSKSAGKRDGAGSPSHMNSGEKRPGAARSRQPAGLPRGPRGRSLPFSVAWQLFAAARVISALLAPISDCDETFNYWEPTHYLQFGHGLQTWEYSPEYAIRSWSYIALHAVVASAAGVLTKDKAKIFIIVRVALALACAYAEARFYKAVVDNVSPTLGRYTLAALLFSTGMFVSSTAYLPSTFAMYTTMLAFSFVLCPPALPGDRTRSKYRVYGAVGWFAFGSAWGWPFAGALAIPFLLEEALYLPPASTGRYIKAKTSEGKSTYEGVMSIEQRRSERPPAQSVLEKRVETSTKECNLERSIRRARLARLFIAGMGAVLILIASVAVDFLFYRRLVLVPFNIVAYNVFANSGRGPSLYGTEPWTFYILNGFLNFNIMFAAALLSLPLLVIAHLRGSTSSLLLAFRVSPVYIWLLIFMKQPHKEERFLFPIYPLICFNAAVAMLVVQKFVTGAAAICFRPRSARIMGRLLVLSCFAAYATMSTARIMALLWNYGAPLEVYTWLSTDIIRTNQTAVDVCVGKEWHRFPGHYFLASEAKLRFVKSEFRGLLPGEFFPGHRRDGDLRAWVHDREGTWQEPLMRMNDLNKEEDDRYVPVSQCDYLVDLDYTSPRAPSPPPLEPRYALQNDSWFRVFCRPFLDSARSSRIARAFYIPAILEPLVGRFVGEKEWADYCVLKSVND